MNDKLDTIKNVAIAGKNYAIAGIIPLINFAAKRFTGIDISAFTNDIQTNLIASEIDHLSLNWLEFKLKNPNSLNHDVLKLSRTALHLTIKGIGKLYKDEVGKEFEKETDTEIKKLVDNAGTNFDNKAQDNEIKNKIDTDAIRFVDKFNFTEENVMGVLFAEISNDLPVICEAAPFNKFFKDNFTEYYKLYFGELLKKPEYSKALIAYQRQVQGLMFEAIKEQKNSLPENIVNEIQKKINELTPEKLTKLFDEVNEKLDNISVKLDEIKNTVTQYFKSKTLIIEKIESGNLKCAEEFNIPANLKDFKEQTTDYLFFKYGSYSCAIEDLTEEYFDYFSQKTKVNHILVKCLLSGALKNICSANDNTNIYNSIQTAEEIGIEWLENESFFCKCIRLIQQNFLEFIYFELDDLYNCGNDIKNDKCKADYVKHCGKITNSIVELSVAVCLTYLLDNNVKSKDIRSKYFVYQFKTNISQLTLLHYLLNTLSEYKEIQSELLHNLLSLKESCDDNGRLNVLCKELEKLGKNTDFDLFDVYIAEKILIEILENFAFLANYKMISIHDIQYHHIKQHEPIYIQCIANEEKENKAIDNPTNSYAIFLQNKSVDNDCLNLFPFVIDLNAWKQNNTSRLFAFFNYYNNNDNSRFLEYNILEKYDGSIKDFNRLFYNEIAVHNKYSFDNIEQHTVNVIVETFEKIMSILTENENEQ